MIIEDPKAENQDEKGDGSQSVSSSSLSSVAHGPSRIASMASLAGEEIHSIDGTDDENTVRSDAPATLPAVRINNESHEQQSTTLIRKVTSIEDGDAPIAKGIPSTGAGYDNLPKLILPTFGRPAPLVSAMREQSTASATSIQHGRPPLKPQVAAGPPQATAGPTQVAGGSPRHKSRGESAGDYSFMSGLTDHFLDGDVDPTTGKVHPSRNRTISWDDNVFEGPNRTNKPSPPMFTRAASNVVAGPTAYDMKSTNSRDKIITLMDINTTSPLESEAETAILQALEEREASRAGSNILSHIPDEGLNSFQAETLSKEGSLDRQSARNDASGGTNHTHSPPSRPKKGHHRVMTGIPPGVIGRDRSNTLESTLLGLTNVMQMIHTESNQHSDDPVSAAGHRRLPSRNILPPDDVPTNNSEALVHNANILFRRTVQTHPSTRSVVSKIITDDTSGKSRNSKNTMLDDPSGKSRSRRNIIPEPHQDPKKTDGDHISERGEDDSTNTRDSNGALRAGVSLPDLELGGQGMLDQSTKGPGKMGQQRRKPVIEQSIHAIVKGTKKVLCWPSHGGKEGWELFSDFLRPKKASLDLYCKTVLFYVFLPATGVSAILFYLTGNPDMGREGATVSWFILFILRQIVTFSMAKATELFIIDFLSLRSRWTVRLLGPVATLVIAQSKGFPFLMFSWSIYDLLLLSGSNDFAKHWLFWQRLIDMCNENNPAGTITESTVNYTILCLGVVLGLAIAIKRVWLGLYLGKRTYLHYGDQLAKVMNKMILVSEVANLGKLGGNLAKTRKLTSHLRETVLPWNMKSIDSMDSQGDDSTGQRRSSHAGSFTPIIGMAVSVGGIDEEGGIPDSTDVSDHKHRLAYTRSFNSSQKTKIIQLLERWEEPELANVVPSDASINAILQFRQALTLMDNDYPFSLSFGLAESRETCVESAQKVYERLMLFQPDDDVLNFDIIAQLATIPNGEIDQKKLKELIRVFRPDREGNLTLLDFVKSVDTVYKSLRLLRASIANSGQIDRAFETLINYAFYIMLGCITLSIFGFNPLALFLSFSSIILAFAFMIGSASAKYFEGILFILVRRPYDIGDRIHISNIEQDTSESGSASWYVENVTLFTTTVRYATTNELATLANGSLANSRIINSARSPKAFVYIYMKFGVDVPYQKVKLFKKAIEAFVKARPREWLSLSGFRATRVEQDLGFIEYVIVLQHRESWQSLVPILESKADLSSFCLEVSKQLDMRYIAPALPVDLTVGKRSQNRPLERTAEGVSIESPTLSSATPDLRAISALFELAKA